MLRGGKAPLLPPREKKKKKGEEKILGLERGGKKRGRVLQKFPLIRIGKGKGEKGKKELLQRKEKKKKEVRPRPYFLVRGEGEETKRKKGVKRGAHLLLQSLDEDYYKLEMFSEGSGPRGKRGGREKRKHFSINLPSAGAEKKGKKGRRCLILLLSRWWGKGIVLTIL